MILTLDIGNTNIKSAVFDGEEMLHYWRISTDQNRTSDEYGMIIIDLLARAGLAPGNIKGIIYSSVVPSVNFTIEHMCRNYFDILPLPVSFAMDTGMQFEYENPHMLGSDRIANAVAVWNIYGGPSIFIDFGTATTFGVVSGEGVFLGGAICPGIRLSAEVLVSGTSKLPRIELARPQRVIGRDTISNMQSGLIHGYVGLVEHLITCMRQEIGDESAQVIATGGVALLIAEENTLFDQLDGLLTLKGLRILYERNQRNKGD